MLFWNWIFFLLEKDVWLCLALSGLTNIRLLFNFVALIVTESKTIFSNFVASPISGLFCSFDVRVLFISVQTSCCFLVLCFVFSN